MLTCCGHDVRLPQNHLVYVAFRLALQDTLADIELQRDLEEEPDSPVGYLSEVPFLLVMLAKGGYTASRSIPEASKGDAMIRNSIGPRAVPLVVGFLAGMLALAFAMPQPVAAQNAAKVNFGEPGPQWLRESESYAIGYDPNGWDALRSRR